MLREQILYPAEAGGSLVQYSEGESLMRRSSSANQCVPLKPIKRSLSSVDVRDKTQAGANVYLDTVSKQNQSVSAVIPCEQRSEVSTDEGQSILVNENTVQEAIGRLRRYRQACSDQGLYKEAKAAHEQIQELQAYLSMVVKQTTKGRHLLERAAVERAHRKEIERFTTSWVRFSFRA